MLVKMTPRAKAKMLIRNSAAAQLKSKDIPYSAAYCEYLIMMAYIPQLIRRNMARVRMSLKQLRPSLRVQMSSWKSCFLSSNQCLCSSSFSLFFSSCAIYSKNLSDACEGQYISKGKASKDRRLNARASLRAQRSQLFRKSLSQGH